MRIDFSSNLYNNTYHQQSVNNFKYNAKYFYTPNYTVSFRQKSDIPINAIESLNQQKTALKSEYDNLSSYNLKELEGLQNGIEIFDGLNFPQVAYLISKLGEIAVTRGCNNACIHCYADAQTPLYMKMNHLNDKIDFEDYENLINGFAEINKRLGFNAFQQNKDDSIALFHDADCSAVYLRDKSGKIYDYADLAKMLHKVTRKKVLFDTAGWNPNDKTTQKRMEDLVQKIVSSNEYDYIKFNISINPFQSIYNKSIELAEKGDFERAEKFRDIYVDRMANVIFTFSPLMDKKYSDDIPMLDVIIRTLSFYSNLKGYGGADFLDTTHKIMNRVEELYTQDLTSDCPKVIKDESQKKRYLQKIRPFEFDLDCHTTLINKKLLNKFDEKQINYSNESNYCSELYKDTISRLFDSVEKGKSFNTGIIDVNGKFYITNDVETYPTDIVLNYKNKGKPTAPVKPNLRGKVITKNIIENL